MDASYKWDLYITVTDGFPEECFLPINPRHCEDTDANPAPDPPHYFFSATEGDYEYGCHQLQPGQCNYNPDDVFSTITNSFATEAECRSRCQGLKCILIVLTFLAMFPLIHRSTLLTP